MAVTLEKLQQHITQKMPSADAEFLKQLSGALFEKASDDFLESFDAEGMTAMTLGALRSLEARKRSPLSVRLFNPTLEGDGWTCPNTVIEIILDDRPFIVDTIRAELKRLGLRLSYLLHPILHLGRDADGKLERKLERSTAVRGEAYELYFVDRLDEARQEEVKGRLNAVLDDLLLATNDYQDMKKQAEVVKETLAALRQASSDETRAADLAECEAFVDWLRSNNFIFLGYREYDLVEDKGQKCLVMHPNSCLGILRNTSLSNYMKPVPLNELSENLRARVISGPLLIVTKTNAEATVHRAVRMDYIGVKKWGPGDETQGEMRFVGLFTSQGLSTPVREIPILRRKLQRVLEMDQALEGSHDFKQIVSIFNSMPREELFWTEAVALHKDIRAIMEIQRQHKVRVTLRPDPLARGVQVMVIMPRDRFNTEVRNRIQELLSARFGATHVDYQLSFGEEEDQVRFHFFFTTDNRLHDLDMGKLEKEVADLTRTWIDLLGEKLRQVQGDVEGARIAKLYAESFDEAYKSATSFNVASKDIGNLERLFSSQDDHFVVDFINAPEDQLTTPCTQLRIAHYGASFHLSDVLPILENLGLKVLVQNSFEVHSAHDKEANLDVFRVQKKGSGQPLDAQADRERFLAALDALLEGRAENDRLNGLVLTTRLSLRQVALLRSYLVHLGQIQPANARDFLIDSLLGNPNCAQFLYEYFEARFKPGLDKREESMESAKGRFFDSLNAVTSLAFDRTLRDLYNLMSASLRTNYFLDKPYISHKINSHEVKKMPEPRPLFEIVVVAPGVDGIHLRGGKVARGGLRWSDRPDFRTEVLGLMKTQMTKNAVIVPVGSKGGFALKNAPKDRAEVAVYVVEQYKTFIRGLLDLTDNNVGGKVTHPEGLVIYDEDDPYLVVAADKGTATFSDIANSVSAEYGFWLGDAFASGGSQGYDHKKEGITARGAWEGVCRHFREMGVNVHKEEITVAGIGDLAGDVFGNGLIYSDTLRLIAAFNHIHIFLDPNPEAKKSYQERVRMFNLPRSSWEDYDKSLISKGGGVFSRASKSIDLSPEIRQALGIEDESLSGEDLVKAILKAPVDLLWNGGIGTYVKSSDERNVDVGDSSNDSVRIDAPELRAKVVGEGGNQGFTQLARIQYALGGGRINTDAIDNSAGVDMSDHEVNIKILFGQMISRGELTNEQRNAVLGEMTDEVNKLVLADNYHQTLSLSISERRSRENLDVFISMMEYLADRGGLRTDVEFLPDSRTLQERVRSGRGFARPELAILMAYSKMGLFRRILETDFPDEPAFQNQLVEYFPTAMQQRFPDWIKRHPLRREIIATQFTNRVIDILGMTFVHRKIQDTGASPIQVVRAALSALEIVGAYDFVRQVNDLDNQVPASDQYGALERLGVAVENVVAWTLLTDADLSSLTDFIQRYKTPLSELRGKLAELLPPKQIERLNRLSEEAKAKGFPEGVAQALVSLEWVPSGLGVIETHLQAKVSLAEAATRYFSLVERFQLSWLRNTLKALRVTDKWEQIALEGLAVELRRVQLQLVLSNQEFPSVDGGLVFRYFNALDEIKAKGTITLAAGDVLARMLGQMAQGAHSHDPRTLETLPALPGVKTKRR
ncbi:MAG: NAD-glutamate dehydrogenase [Candidatus Eremiobacteraeota bacterium]|nr:NAD-glutamate dehydrogenase [Candidatus Eremiobacteraeota bacterium]